MFYDEIIKAISEKEYSKDEFNALKMRLSKKHGIKKTPTEVDILMHCNQEQYHLLKSRLLTKPTRTGSGVAVIAVMTKPHECPHAKDGGPCTMCPGGPKSVFGDIPQSYTGNEPATMRAMRNNYDPYLQVFNRLEQYVVLGQSPEKVELIIMGGTFPALDASYKEEFITQCFKAMNDFSDMFYHDVLDIEKFKAFFELPGDVRDDRRSKKVRDKIRSEKTDSILEDEHIKNEVSHIRCVGMTIETRPDYGRLLHGNELLRYGCTRIELGVQTTSDESLSLIRRGHTVKDSIDSARELRDLGFKLNFHLMPGLLGSTSKSDKEMLLKIVDDPDFRPDMIKIYPLMVMPGTKLYEDWKKGDFTPITTEQAANLIADFKSAVPVWVRIMRVQRDIPTKVIEAGVDRTNLRQYVMKHMEEKGTQCRCIRCREPRGKDADPSEAELVIRKYDAGRGIEYFISFEDIKKDILFGFIRLRFPSKPQRKEIGIKTSLVRELHVYGKAASLSEEGEVQHQGFGSRLLKMAETISKQSGMDNILIISGVGVRRYYLKFGYEKKGPYMGKKI